MERSILKRRNLLRQCVLVSELSTCNRRKVGCITTDENGIILSTGRNGTPRGLEHCNSSMCGTNHESGKNLDSCMAIHAEINALLFCPDINKIHTIYVTTSPCVSCMKAILNTSCKVIVYRDDYTEEHLEKIKLMCKDRITIIKELTL